jgi:hypothetical protein
MGSTGLLFAGNSEIFAFAAHLLKLKSKTVYGLSPEGRRLALASARGTTR